jgi:exopolyphosphatase / guanosine-5'-triphosphate,3'-diphosphate pyrophosphatase
MRLAVIDCGTNTFNLLIVDLADNKSYYKLLKTRVAVKLGEGGINKGFIAPAAFQRAIEAMQTFSNLIKEYGVKTTLAFATSAIRDASNGEEFVEKIKAQFNIHITIIDGNREAEFIYLGVKEAVKLVPAVSLIMDIGGGSTEFIFVSNRQLLWKQSFRIGAARLLEKFSPSDPITEKEIQSIHRYLDEQLPSLFDIIKTLRSVELIGSSGAFDSIIEMIHGELDGEPLMDSKTEYEVNLHQYHHISTLVKKSTMLQRKQIKGLVPMRFDMIVISCIMVDYILQTLRLKKLRISTYSLKEGVLIDFIQKLN